MLELGAGIGRFTGELAQKAGELIALDFIDSVIKKVYYFNQSPSSTNKVFLSCLEILNVIFLLSCRMKVSMGTTRMSSLCVLMLHPLTSRSLMDPLT